MLKCGFLTKSRSNSLSCLVSLLIFNLSSFSSCFPLPLVLGTIVASYIDVINELKFIFKRATRYFFSIKFKSVDVDKPMEKIVKFLQKTQLPENHEWRKLVNFRSVFLHESYKVLVQDGDLREISILLNILADNTWKEVIT